MKKKIFGSIAVLAIAVIATFNVNVNAQESGLSDVSLDNVEALASETSSGHCSRLCWSSPVWYCVLESSTSYIYCFERYPY